MSVSTKPKLLFSLKSFIDVTFIVQIASNMFNIIGNPMVDNIFIRIKILERFSLIFFFTDCIIKRTMLTATVTNYPDLIPLNNYGRC